MIMIDNDNVDDVGDDCDDIGDDCDDCDDCDDVGDDCDHENPSPVLPLEGERKAVFWSVNLCDYFYL